MTYMGIEEKTQQRTDIALVGMVVLFVVIFSGIIVVVGMTMREYVTQLTTQLANMTTNKTDRNQNSVS